MVGFLKMIFTTFAGERVSGAPLTIMEPPAA